MNYSQLKSFHFVAVMGGFSRAAEHLLLTQPAVSEQVRNLEQEFDTLLFTRQRKRVQLTKAGHELLILTKKMFETWEQIEDFLKKSQSVPTGELRIVADSAHHIVDVLSAFHLRFPNVHVTLNTGNSSEVLNKLRNYGAEIGVVGSVSPGSDMQAIELSRTPIVGFAAKGTFPESITEMTLAEVARHPLVFREEGSKTRQELEHAAGKQGLSLRPAFEVEGREALRDVVAAGAGIGFISQAEFIPDDRLRMFCLKDSDATMSEKLIYLKHRADVRVIRSFIDVFKTLPSPGLRPG